MVTTPDSHETDAVTPPEWRRHFYDRTDGAALILAVFAGLGAAGALSGAVLAATVQSSHPSIVVAWGGGAMFAAGFASSMTGLSGVTLRRKNRVTVEDGVTYVGAGAGLPLAMGGALLWLGLIALGIGLITADRTGVLQLSDNRHFPSFVVGIGAMIFLSFWALAFVPMGRRLEFSPHELAGQLGADVIRIPWDSIDEVSIYRGPSALRPFGLGQRTEIAFTTTDEAAVPEVPHDYDPDSYPVGLASFNVDEDTLYNVILAARSHPEIRQLLGREEGTILFDGPPVNTRQGMFRSQVWLPWEQRIQEALETTPRNHTVDPSRRAHG